jgi:hypothetical protein
VQDVAAVVHPQVDDPPRVALLADLQHPRAFQHRDGLVVTDRCGVHHVLEQRALVGEVEVHGLDRDPGTLGHLVEQRGPVAVGHEQLGGRRDDAPPGGPRLLGPGPARRSVGFLHPLDFARHSLEPTLVTH